jgi:CRISPR/Cas system Type II protein with McrA/HNH and RuvC-like nuclease domain
MKIQTRKIAERTLEYTDNITGKKEKIKESYENGFVEELEVSLQDITAFNLNKKIRMIGIAKQGTFLLTLKSWKELKKELTKAGLMNRFNLSKAN